MKIKVKLFEGGKMPQVNEEGDLFDVFARTEVALNAPQAGIQRQVNLEKVRDVVFSNELIPVGFAMEIPAGFKANLLPRSSTYKKWGIIFGNHVGQIDSSYCGDNDEWMVNAIALRRTTINAGDKIAQFEIIPSAKATMWQKLKWLFSSKIKFIQVASLGNDDRGGFGTTGSK